MTVLLLLKDYAHVLDHIVPILRELTHNQFEYIAAELDESTVAVITIFNKFYSREVHAFLFSQNVNEVASPRTTRTCPSTRPRARVHQPAAGAGPTDRADRLDPAAALSVHWRGTRPNSAPSASGARTSGLREVPPISTTPSWPEGVDRGAVNPDPTVRLRARHSPAGW